MKIYTEKEVITLLKEQIETCAKIADGHMEIDIREHGLTTRFGNIRADEAKQIARDIRQLEVKL